MASEKRNGNVGGEAKTAKKWTQTGRYKDSFVAVILNDANALEEMSLREV